MNIEMILPEYREEMTGALGRLREMVLEGTLSVGQFLRGRERIYGSYLCASVARAAGVGVRMLDPLTCRAEVTAVRRVAEA
jgi:hypothetical protein